jgi:hypothetical protein
MSYNELPFNRGIFALFVRSFEESNRARGKVGGEFKVPNALADKRVKVQPSRIL